MKLTTDTSTYPEQQEIFTGEMVARVADHLKEAGIEGEVLKDLTGKIVFEVACMLDGVSDVSFDGSESQPFLSFLNSQDEIIDFGGNSYTHELVFGILNAMFKDDT